MAHMHRPTGAIRLTGRFARPMRWAVLARLGPVLTIFLTLLPASVARTEDENANAFEPGRGAEGGVAEPSVADVEPAVLLPVDRDLERSLDRARRLAADGRWSDAVALLDELLAGDRDAFLDRNDPALPRSSVRTLAEQTIAELPRAGRDAYLLLTRAQADRQLATAIATGDQAGILAVARRWFHTPAGRRAGMLAALRALEAGEPLTAASWCDRVAESDHDEFGPTLAVMRSLAHYQAKDPRTAVALLEAAARTGGGIVRIAGREESLSAIAAKPESWLAKHGGPTGDGQAGAEDWRQLGGHPGRNATVNASRPLLVPRYRVPLVRHPDEATMLERCRRTAADAGRALIPAASPLAVGDYLVTPTPLGILAIDFDSGRRLWLSSAVPAAGPNDSADEAGGELRPSAGDRCDRTFDDATSGTLASDGRLVFAVESPPEALAAELTLSGFGGRGFLRAPADWYAGNMLSAYDLDERGRVRWRIPNRDEPPTDQQAGPSPAAWYLGPPLVLGEELCVLVERQAEVSLDVLGADDGQLRWSQPLATYDEGDSIAHPSARGRRLAGLTPAFVDGLVICPIGGGCIVAVNSATRSLAWASSYARSATGQGPAAGGDLSNMPIQRGDPCPVVATGRVLVTPVDADSLLCLDARTGDLEWQLPTRGRMRVAGVVDGRVIVTTAAAVEALDLETGRSAWRWPCPAGVHPSGRGILTGDSLLLPLDSPEVVEIDLADGSVRGRSRARGGAIPGHLVPHRGEIVSRGIDSLDVFHQEAVLEDRIETASRSDPADPWAMVWRAHLAIERGDVAAGLDALMRVRAMPQVRLPPDALAGAVERAVGRDFAAVADRWQMLRSAPADVSPAVAMPGVARMMVDGWLAEKNAEAAWGVCRELLDAGPEAAGEAAPLVHDSAEPTLTLTADRWLESRLASLTRSASPQLRREIDQACSAAVDAATRQAPPRIRQRTLERLIARLGRHPAAEQAVRALASNPPRGREAAIRLELLGCVTPATESNLEAVSTAGSAGGGWNAAAESAWPLGEVECRRWERHRPDGQQPGGVQTVPLEIAGSTAADARAARAVFLLGERQVLVADRLGRPVGDPLTVGGSSGAGTMPWTRDLANLELAVIGRLLFVRTGTGLASYDLEPDGDGARMLWSRDEYGRERGGGGDRWGGGTGSRVSRDGAIPLGMRIVEPDDLQRGGNRGLIPIRHGLIVPGRGMVTMLDPVTGTVLWERHRIAPGVEWVADEAVLCGCTPNGRESVVLDCRTGRLREICDLPERRQRLPVPGRKLVAVRTIDEVPGRLTARRVRLDLVDPLGCGVVSLGEYSGECRAVATTDGRLAVLAADGLLTVLDLQAGATVFQTSLPDPPAEFDRLIVQTWHDRYLVLAGGHAEDDSEELSPLQPLLSGPVAGPPLSASIWAVGRRAGELLWPAAATIERHDLLATQPDAAPVLIFGRLLPPEFHGRESHLSVICLDKRTGHAVAEDERLAVMPYQAAGCRIEAQEAAHAVTIEAAPGGERLGLVFTGRPLPPQPPHQSGGRPPGAEGIAGFLRRAGVGTRAAAESSR